MAEKSEAVAAKNRILAIRDNLPHLEGVGTKAAGGGYQLTVAFREGVLPAEQQKVEAAAQGIPVEYQATVGPIRFGR